GKRVFAFQAVEQRAFFAANVSTRTAPQMDFETEAASKNLLAEQTRRFRLSNRALQNAERLRIFVTQVDETARRTGRVAGEGHAFQHRVRIIIHDRAILETARLAFVGVTDDTLRLARRVGHGLPLRPRGESRAAA